MDYEKLHKDTINKLQQMVSCGKITVETACGICADFVPESEDERIRKELINGFNKLDKSVVWYDGITNGQILAWLEKQGESYTKRDVDDAYLKGVTNTKNEIEKQYEANYQIRKDIATFIFNYRGDIKNRAKWMDYLGIKVSFVEKQGKHTEFTEKQDDTELRKYIEVASNVLMKLLESDKFQKDAREHLFDKGDNDLSSIYDIYAEEAVKYVKALYKHLNK